MTMRPATLILRSSRRRDEGAVLFIVLFVLMIASASALVGVHATGSELRSAGSIRRAMVVEGTAESAIAGLRAVMDTYEPAQVDQVIVQRMPADTAAVGAGGLGLAEGARFYPQDFAGAWGQMPAGFNYNDVNVEAASLGRLLNYDVTAVVDVQERFRGTNIPGFASGDMCMMNYTASSAARLGPDGVLDPATANVATLRLHATGADARAILTAGPIFYDCP